MTAGPAATPRHRRIRPPPTAAVELHWIPLGAGDCFVRFNGKVYEALIAALARRPRNDIQPPTLLTDEEPIARRIIETPGRSREPDSTQRASPRRQEGGRQDGTQASPSPAPLRLVPVEVAPRFPRRRSVVELVAPPASRS